MKQFSLKSVSPEIYNRKYYSSHDKGFQWILNKISPYLKIKKNLNVLDIGCGSGNLSIYLAKKGVKVTGIDYSKDAIENAKKNLSKENKSIRKNVKFIRMNAVSMNFNNSSFDMVISIDVFEHLYPYEIELLMRKIKQILKPNAVLFIHTEANKIYLDYLHKYYIYPMDRLLIRLNGIITGKEYPGLPKDPRNEYHKVQHVNEPTYFSLKILFNNHGFKGRIYPMNLYKKHLSWKDIVYNTIVLFYPISLIPPFSWFFAYDFICVMKNKYENRCIS